MKLTTAFWLDFLGGCCIAIVFGAALMFCG